MADGNTANTDRANSHTGANAGDVQSRLAANERARQVLNEQASAVNGASMANATLNKLAENSRARNQLRGKIDAIVDRQEGAESGDVVNSPVVDSKVKNNLQTKSDADKKQDAVLSNGKKKNRKRMWIIICVALAILAIGGGVTAAILLNNGGDEEVSEEGSDSEAGGCGAGGESDDGLMSEEELNDIIGSVLSEANEITDLDEKFAYIEGQIENYVDTEAEFALRMQLIYIMLNNGYEERALEVAEKIDDSVLYEKQTLEYFSVMSKIYAALGYPDMATRYQEQYAMLYSIVYDESEYGGGDIVIDDQPIPLEEQLGEHGQIVEDR